MEGTVQMEAHPGVFVSRASTDDWEDDPDVPGSQMHELVHADGVWAGFTRITSADHLEPWAPDRREVAVGIEGAVRMQVAEGGTLGLGGRALSSLPRGVETIWHVTTPFKEMWVLASD